MPIPDEFRELPEVPFDGPDRGQNVWSVRRSGELDHGSIVWRGQRYWYAFHSYDHEDEGLRFAVYPLTPEEARILDDWHVIEGLLDAQLRSLREFSGTATFSHQAKAAQVSAFQSTFPRFQSQPPIAHFFVSDHGPKGRSDGDKEEGHTTSD